MKKIKSLIIVLLFIFSIVVQAKIIDDIDNYFLQKVTFYVNKDNSMLEKIDKLRKFIVDEIKDKIDQGQLDFVEDLIKNLYSKYGDDLVVIKDLIDDLEKMIKVKVLNSSDWQLTSLLVLVQRISNDISLNYKSKLADAISRWKVKINNPNFVGAYGEANSSSTNDNSGNLKKKEWTVMVYINADNDLESAGIEDINEMEQVGSNSNMNIVVQIDRAEGYDASNGDWTDARRYYIVPDMDDKKINSKLLEDLGEVDMGDAKTLSNFVKFAISNFPAKKYLLVIWNHGAGWKAADLKVNKGVSYDEQSGNNLDYWALKIALSNIKKYLGRKLDIVAFDACLMGMVEVAYQIKDFAKIMIGSEQTEPGDGWPYEEILQRLANNPKMQPKQLAEDIVEAYVKSYEGGIQGWGKVTQAAIDLEKINELVKKIDDFSKVMLDTQSQSLLQLAKVKTRNYDDPDYYDLYGLIFNVFKLAKDKKIKDAAAAVLNALGTPKAKARVTRVFNNPIRIALNRPAELIWGINGWKLPPRKFWPDNSKKNSEGKLVTPLQKVNDNLYQIYIGPFIGGERVDVINYVIHYLDDDTYSPEGKIANASIRFSDKVIIAEGHTPEMEGSNGLSIYVTSGDEYLISYKNLDFSMKTHWDELISSKAKFIKKAPILLVADTGSLYSNMVYSKVYKAILSNINLPFDLWIPQVYGKITSRVLNKYRDGLVIWFTGSNFNAIDGYEAIQLYRWARNGGRGVIMGTAVEQLQLVDDTLRKVFGVIFDRDIEAKKAVFNFGDNNTLEVQLSSQANYVTGLPTVFSITGRKTKAIGFIDSSPVAVVSSKYKANKILVGFGLENLIDLKQAISLMEGFVKLLQYNLKIEDTL